MFKTCAHRSLGPRLLILSLVGVGVLLIGSPAAAQGPPCLDVQGALDARRTEQGTLIGTAELDAGQLHWSATVDVEVLEEPAAGDDGQVRARVSYRLFLSSGNFLVTASAVLAPPQDSGEYHMTSADAPIEEGTGDFVGVTGRLSFAGDVSFGYFRQELSVSGQICPAGGAK